MQVVGFMHGCTEEKSKMRPITITRQRWEIWKWKQLEGNLLPDNPLVPAWVSINSRKFPANVCEMIDLGRSVHGRLSTSVKVICCHVRGKESWACSTVAAVYSFSFIVPRFWSQCHIYLCKKQRRYWILCRTERRQVEIVLCHKLHFSFSLRVY